MRQVYVGSANQVNKWFKDNPNKKLIDIQFSNNGICVIYEESDLVGY